MKKKQGKLYTYFVDFKTSLDSIDRGVSREKIKKLGLRGRFLRAIDKIYNQTLNEIITREGITEKFGIRKGVRQGCPLSVLLFLIHIEDLEEKWLRKKVGVAVIGKEKLYCLKFADDVVMVAEMAEDLKVMLKRVNWK